MCFVFQHTAARRRLPPARGSAPSSRGGFNTQPPEGGCHQDRAARVLSETVSTHSRPKAAAAKSFPAVTGMNMFQHTAARRRLPHQDAKRLWSQDVSTHSRPKAAAEGVRAYGAIRDVSTHSRPKAAAAAGLHDPVNHAKFQHTAARRRLQIVGNSCRQYPMVSTHSRPKAAAAASRQGSAQSHVSTHSRPKAAACT